MLQASHPTPTVLDTGKEMSWPEPYLVQRADPPTVTDYPDCSFVDADVQTCYPTSDTVVYQNQWTRIIWNTRYTLFVGDNDDGQVTLVLKDAETDNQVGNWTQPNNLGRYSLAVDDSWWDSRAVSLWQGQPRNWTFYWEIFPSTHTVDGSEIRQPTFIAVQTALPNYALSASSASVISQSLASESSSIAAADSSSAQAAQSSRDAALQSSHDNNYFPAWAIALIVVLGVISIVTILTLFFVLLRGARRRRHRRSSMGSESPMMQAPGAPLSAEAASPVNVGGTAAFLPPPVRNAPSIRYDNTSIGSRANSAVVGGGEGVITNSDAAIMADAFRKALRKPDFADRPQEEGESPETNGANETEEQLLSRELAEEGRNIRSVSSEKGVKVVTDVEGPK